MNDSPGYSTTEIAAEEVIRLLEERLLINRSKRKVGEVTVRKVVETQIVEVPVRREKLVVEQVSLNVGNQGQTRQIAPFRDPFNFLEGENRCQG